MTGEGEGWSWGRADCRSASNSSGGLIIAGVGGESEGGDGDELGDQGGGPGGRW